MQTSNTGQSRLPLQSIEYKEMRDALIRLLSDAIDHHTPHKPSFICQSSNRHYRRKAANVGVQS